jgi:putative nucleotidyltransferase with HDIG domain
LNEIVPSGAFSVSKKKKGFLEAFLGTCVGVTLIDRKANVGGLLHILLPEPTGADIPYCAETYASTGLPIFIGALCRAGASERQMEACVAGGALIGPVSELDLELNIGGRSTQVVQEFLRQKDIPLKESETGGFFSCRLRLNSETWESDIQPIYEGTTYSHCPSVKPSPEEIESAILHVKPIPQIALKIIHLLEDRDYDMKDLAVEVQQDQVISGKVINLCNSALLSMRNKIDSVKRALVVLGEKKLLQLVISAAVQSLFPEEARGYSLCKGGMFQHALGTALLAHELAALMGRIAPDTAYTAGLLHDIGKIPLDQYVAGAAPLFYRVGDNGMGELREVEREHFGVTHTEVGGLMGDRWALPENLIDVIRNHHQPEDAAVDEELVTLVYLADLIMSRFRVGNEMERLNTDRLVNRLERLGLTPSQLPILIDRISPNIFQASLMGA